MPMKKEERKKQEPLMNNQERLKPWEVLKPRYTIKKDLRKKLEWKN